MKIRLIAKTGDAHLDALYFREREEEDYRNRNLARAREQHRKKWASARKHSLDYNLTEAYIQRLYDEAERPGTCPVFGTLFDWYAKKSDLDNAPSLDRVIPKRGYIQGNVRIISWRANRIKHEATLDELKKLVRYVETHIT